MKFIEANLAETPLIAKMHADCIAEGFLSQLGIPFLALLYKGLIDFPGGVLVVAKDDERPIGFIAGVTDAGKFYKHFLRKNFIRSSLVLMGRIFYKDNFYKIWEIFFYPHKVSQKVLPRAELLSMAVEVNYRRKGIGDLLFDSLVDKFKKQEIGEFKIIVGSNLTSAKSFYHKKGCEKSAELEIHKGQRSDVLVRMVS